MTVLLCLGGWFVLSVVAGLLFGQCIGVGAWEPAVVIVAGRLLVVPKTEVSTGHTAALLAITGGSTAAVDYAR